MDKLKELRMTLVILVIGTFFISGCFFNNKHTVTFKTNGGTEIKNVSVKSGSKLENVAEPKKDGYIFDGWYLEGEEFDFDSKIDEDLTLVAKWIKVDIASNDVVDETTTEPVTSSTETTSSSTTAKTTTANKIYISTTKKATTTTTTKSSTSTSQTNNAPVQVVTPTTASTTKSTVPTPTVPPLNVDVTVPVVTTQPTEPVTEPTKEPDEEPEIPVLEPTNLKIEKEIREVVVNEETNDIEEIEVIMISKTVEESNVVSNISTDDLTSIIESDMKNWSIVSGNGYSYVFNFTEEEVNALELIGDNSVQSLTVQIDGEAYLFNYDEVEEKWYVQYPTVSVGTSTLDIRYFNDLQTAINNAKKGETVTLLSDVEISETIIISLPIIFDGEGYEITKKNDYLFNIENMLYEEDDELIFNNMSLNVDSLIYNGTSTFDKIIINASDGVLSGVTIDNNYQLVLNNTNLLYSFR